MSEPLARADFLGERGEAADVRAAAAAGWTTDQDGWWARRCRPGDVGQSFFCERRYRNQGFLCRDQVFARTPKVALAYDEAARK